MTDNDELYPRHVKALAWAVREAEAWRGNLVGNPDPRPLAAFDAQVKQAKEALKIVRELARQDAGKRRRAKGDAGFQ